MAVKKKKIELEDLAVLIGQNSKDIKNLAGLVGQNGKDIENLAIMTKNGFDDMDKRMNNRFEQMDEKIDRVHYDLSHRIEGLELKVSSSASSWTRDFDSLHEWIEELEHRVSEIEDRGVNI